MLLTANFGGILSFNQTAKDLKGGIHLECFHQVWSGKAVKPAKNTKMLTKSEPLAKPKISPKSLLALFNPVFCISCVMIKFIKPPKIKVTKNSIAYDSGVRITEYETLSARYA